MKGKTDTLFRALAALDSICRESSAPAPLLSLDDPLEGLREPFVRWLDSECEVHPRCFGGVSALHLAFCEWMIARREVPCNRAEFEALLGGLGLFIGEVDGTWLASGLILRADLEAHQALEGGCQQ